MSNKYLTNFADQESALSYTGGGETLISPQVSLIEGDTELVYSKEIPHGSKIKFEKNEETGKLYFVVDGVYMDVGSLIYKTLSDKASMPVIEYNEVDLDLPSGLKWSDRNVGAVTPHDYGMYFSWGNTDGVLYTRENMLVKDFLYKYAESAGMPDSQIDEIMSQEGWEEMIKTKLSVYGFIEGYSFDSIIYESTLGGQFTGNTLDNEHDAATQWMGTIDISGVTKTWRMPTSGETMELVNNTTQTVDTENGGMIFTSKTNGKSIFIPFAGSCFGSQLFGDGSGSFVWSSSVDEGVPSGARYLNVSSSGDVDSDTSNRFIGPSVRGVVG